MGRDCMFRDVIVAWRDFSSILEPSGTRPRLLPSRRRPFMRLGKEVAPSVDIVRAGNADKGDCEKIQS
jgi:hypothetical protein